MGTFHRPVSYLLKDRTKEQKIVLQRILTFILTDRELHKVEH